MLESLVPRLAPLVRVETREDGTAVLVDPRRGVYAEIAADQATLVALLDGARSAPEIAAEHYQRHRFVPFQAFGDLLATLRLFDLLGNSSEELDRAGVPRPTSFLRTRGLASVRLARIPARGLAPIAAGLFIAWILWVAGTAALAFVNDPLWPFAAHIDPLRPDGSPIGGLLYVGFGASLAFLFRSVARSGLGALLGAPPLALEARLHYGVPALELEAGVVKRLSRRRRLASFGSALFAPFHLALAWLVIPTQPEEAVSAALGAALVGFIDACPFAPTSMGCLLATLAGKVDLRDHARSYLSRRLLSRLGAREFFEGERVILLTAALAAVWSLAGIEMLSRNAPREVTGLFAAATTLAGNEAHAAHAAIGLVWIATVAGLLLMVQTLLVALGSVVPASMWRRPAQARERKTLLEADQDAVGSLSRVPLFAALPAEGLAGLSKEVERVLYNGGDVIVRQGDPGDRFYAIVDGSVSIVREHDSGLERVVAELSAGDCFGETALLSPVPRTATVRARTAVTALALSREGFERLVKAMPQVDLTRMIRAAAALNRSPLFSALPPERISTLLPRLTPKAVGKGELVFLKGEAGDCFYLVDDGELEVLDEASAAPVAKLSAGDHFGEIALLRDIPRTASVRAVRDSALYALSKADFFGVLARDLSLSRALEEEARVRVRGGR